jgi:hypothetical protein
MARNRSRTYPPALEPGPDRAPLHKTAADQAAHGMSDEVHPVAFCLVPDEEDELEQPSGRFLNRQTPSADAIVEAAGRLVVAAVDPNGSLFVSHPGTGLTQAIERVRVEMVRGETNQRTLESEETGTAVLINAKMGRADIKAVELVVDGGLDFRLSSSSRGRTRLVERHSSRLDSPRMTLPGRSHEPPGLFKRLTFKGDGSSRLLKGTLHIPTT